MRIPSLEVLGQLLGYSKKELARVLRNRRRYEKTKDEIDSKGKTRLVYMSWGPLRKIQDAIKKLLDNEQDHVIVHSRKKHSAFTNAKCHVGEKTLVNLDIKNFFPSISVKKVFHTFKRIGCGDDVARILARYTTFEGKVPQGGPTSNKVSSLVLKPTDQQLYEFCQKRKLKVSRYVDDISISGVGADRFRSQLISIVERSGLAIQNKKTKVSQSHQRQSVTGYNVNTKPGVGRKRKRELRALCHKCQMNGLKTVALEHGDDYDKFVARLRGWVNQAAGEDKAWRDRMLVQAGVF